MIRIKLSYYKVFHRTSISKGNEKKKQQKNPQKTETFMSKGVSILELSRILMYDFW